MKTILLLVATASLSGCITGFPDAGMIEVPIPGDPPKGSALLGRSSLPAPCTIVGYKTPEGGTTIGNRVQIVSNPDQIWLKIFDEPLPE